MKYLKLYEEFANMRKIASGYGWSIFKQETTGLYYFCQTTPLYGWKNDAMYQGYDSMLELISKKNLSEIMPYTFNKKQEMSYNLSIIKFIEKLKSYNFQKKYITEHPERIDDLKKFGYNERILKEFKHLFVGKEWGFFDLERSSI